MAVTIKEIAQIAGVSRGTVDKALNDRPGIRNDTREKILKIAKNLNYHPNFIGKVLVNNGTLVKIGVLLTPQYNPFIDLVMQGIQAAQDEFENFNGRVIVKTSISLEPQEQIWLLNELEAENVSGIAVLPAQDPAFVAHINQLHDRGIEVVTFNSWVEGIKQLCFVGPDHYKGGRTAAGLMAKMIPDGGEVGVIISSKYLSCHNSRLRGFREKMEELDRGIRIVEVMENQDLKSLAFRQTLDYCKKYPDLRGIYLAGGGEAGAARALELLNMHRKVVFICHDVVPEITEFMHDGIVDFVLEQDGFQQGYQSVKILFEKLIKDVSPASDMHRIPVTIVTEDSL